MLTMTAHGRIGRDAELRYTTDNTPVIDLAIGCNYGRKDANGKRPSQWVRASIWGKHAEALAEYLTKGKGVAVILSDVHVREFDKNDGTKGSSLEGRVQEIEFTGAGPRDEPAQAPIKTPPAQRPSPQKPAQSTGFDDMDYDIPF
jgi:single-strand DNA-binding protein